MFKNLILYRILPPWNTDLAQAEADLARHPFEPCGPTQELAWGWVSPRGQANGALLESVGGHWLAVLRLEVRALPADVVAREVDARVAQIETQSGRKPGKRERRDLKDEVRLSLLPQAFTKQTHVRVWIAPEQAWLALDAASSARADQVLVALQESWPALHLAVLQTAQSPSACMADWLVERESPSGFSVDREAELRASDESRSVVRYSRHALDTDEVVAHVQAGLMPTRLALTWADRVSFVLSDSAQLKRIAFTDLVFEGRSTDKEDDFDADLALFSGEFVQLLPDLIAALGGEAQPGAASANTPSQPAADAACAATPVAPTPAVSVQAAPRTSAQPPVAEAARRAVVSAQGSADAPF